MRSALVELEGRVDGLPFGQLPVVTTHIHPAPSPHPSPKAHVSGVLYIAEPFPGALISGSLLTRGDPTASVLSEDAGGLGLLTLGLWLWAPATVTQGEWGRGGPSLEVPCVPASGRAPSSIPPLPLQGRGLSRSWTPHSDFGGAWRCVGAGQGVWRVVVPLMAYTKPLAQS